MFLFIDLFSKADESIASKWGSNTAIFSSKNDQKSFHINVQSCYPKY